jgi:hypothetical protein
MPVPTNSFQYRFFNRIGQLQPFAVAAEISRKRPYAPASRSSGGGGCVPAAPGRRGGRAARAASGAAGDCRRGPGFGLSCMRSLAGALAQRVTERTVAGRGGAAAAHARRGERPRCDGLVRRFGHGTRPANSGDTTQPSCAPLINVSIHTMAAPHGASRRSKQVAALVTGATKT